MTPGKGAALAVKFEGPEKKLEIILKKPLPGLRSNSDGRWDRVVAAAGAHIISHGGTQEMDAYLLSESSLFVWEDRVLLITCGRTQLIGAVPEIARMVGRQNVDFVFYERKNFLYPGDQPSDFEVETASLIEEFPGKSYRLGPANHDHIHVFYSSHGKTGRDEDNTLQLLMSELDPAVMEIFTGERAKTADGAHALSGMDGLYPGMAYDHYLFSPEGYSLNGMAEKHYYTIHVTPQSEGSYVSFETNVTEENYAATIEKVVSIFRPGKFSLALTHSLTGTEDPHDFVPPDVAGGYRTTEKSAYAFDCGYGVLFMNKILKEKGEQ